MNFYDILFARRMANQGDITTEGLSVTENGTYTAPTGKAYTPVVVNVEGYAKKSIPNTPTAIATFNASALPMPSLKVGIEATQDLHGYDSPWVGGSGKNKLNLSTRASATAQGITSEVKADNTIVASGTSTGNGDITCPVGTSFTMASGETYTISLSGTDTRTNQFAIFIGTSYRNVGYIPAAEHSLTFTVTSELVCNQVMLRSSNGATININVKLQIEKGSTATTYAPYENICPIEGWTEANVYDTGVNVWDEEWRIDASQFKAKNLIPVKPNTSYFFKSPLNAYSAFKYDINGNSLGTMILPKDAVFTTDSNTYYIWFSMSVNDYGTTYNNDISINYPSTDTEYHAYNGTTYTTTLKDGQGNPLTCYGGSVDVVSGVLTVDRVSLTVDENSNIISGSGGLPFRIDLLTGAKASSSASALTGVKCNFLKEVAQSSSWGVDGTFSRVTTDAKIVYFKVNSEITTIQQLKTFLQSNNLQFVYELATPITIPQDNLAIATQDGTNNLWADSGDVIDGEYMEAL